MPDSFTPGPWTVRTEGIEAWKVTHGPPEWPGYNGVIAILPPVSASEPDPSEPPQTFSHPKRQAARNEAQANAYLIAAAPDLLAVARRAASEGHSRMPWAEGYEHVAAECDACCAAAAVAKATGGL